ncbi:hypothetical protein O7598_02425 [Micromonospora sp. WMMC241]|uniref:hypothetical protein n=1 Tax=Micromonospora sp. WMMC241 TaxID=3015159 RepID=UPI0022B69E68|nr:hypothetical protein [Micromonospora sp. WMMC241]MCZ7435241.1 hypothetical protein [Micromonospora sp. WMMC241]
MIDAISAAVVRHRRPILVADVLLAAGNAAAMAYAPDVADALVPLILLLALTGLLLSIISLGRRRAALVVLPRRPAFAAPVPAWRVLLTLGLLGQSSVTVGAYLRSTEAGISTTFDAVVGALWLGVIALLVVAAWRGDDVRLSPDGVRTIGLLGSRTVPWEAGPGVAVPRDVERPPLRLPLTVAEPALARRRGLVGRATVPVDSVEPRFLAAVVSHYVAHPQHRTAIGTPDEYQRLLTHLRGATG